jgi:subtilase family serine protease
VAASSTGFYLSANSVLDAADPFLGDRAVPGLGANVTSTVTTSLQIPSGTAPGSYYLLAKADRAGVVPESDESNNTRVASIRIGPDLTVTASAPTSASAGSSFTATDTTKNPGADAAPASSTRFYLSINSALDSSDVLLGSRPVPALTAGASHAGSVTLTIPPATAVRTYFLLAVADGDGTIAEALENNNTAARTISVTAPPGP